MEDGVGEMPYNAERGGVSGSSLLLSGGLQRGLQRRQRKKRDGEPSSLRNKDNNRGEPAITEETRKPLEEKAGECGFRCEVTNGEIAKRDRYILCVAMSLAAPIRGVGRRYVSLRMLHVFFLEHAHIFGRKLLFVIWPYQES